MDPANLIGSILFSSIGFVAFIYGKKQALFKPMLFGGLLVGFPYFISNTLWMYVVGAVLTAALFLFRD